MLSKLMTSPRTTILGIAAILAAIASAITALFDGNSETMPEWSLVAAAITGGLANIMARDNGTTSEEAHGLNQPKRIADADAAADNK